MYSAFGVDHGYEEIEKWSIPGAGAISRLGSAMGGKTTSMGAGLRRMGGRNKSMATKAGKKGNKSFQVRGQGRLGQAQSAVGARLKQAGGAMSRNPGVTGGTAVGTTALGVGGGGYALGHDRKQF